MNHIISSIKVQKVLQDAVRNALANNKNWPHNLCALVKTSPKSAHKSEESDPLRKCTISDAHSNEI